MSRVRRRLFHAAMAVILLAGGVCLAASDRPVLTSTWRDRDIRIDGNDEDWRDLTQPVKGQHFSVGFVNDDEALYFCLLTKDATTLQQVSRVGLILWLDPAGGKKKTFGVRFPVAYGPGYNRRPNRSSGGEGDTPSRGPDSQSDPAQHDIEILGPGRNDVREVENGQSGVTARYRIRGDLLVYEIRIPLRKSEQVPFAPGVDPGAALRVELQTPEWRGPVPLRRGGPMIGVGVGRPGGGVFYPGMDTAVLKPLDIAADLRLATRPDR
jgi:hypothetical protein